MTNEILIEKINNGEDKEKNLLLLFNNNLGIIHTIILPYTKRYEYDDLKQEAFIGLYNALCTYDETRGSFASYFPFYVKSQLKEYNLNNSSLKVSHDTYNLLMKCERIISSYVAEYNREPTQKELSQLLIIAEDRVNQLLQYREQMKTLSLSSPIPGGEEDIILADTIADVNEPYTELIEQLDNEGLSKTLDDALSSLPSNQSEAIRDYYYDNKTYNDIATANNCSISNVRIRINNGLRNIRKSKYRKQLREYAEEQFGRSYRGSLSSFANTQTSITEDIAIKLYERNRKELQKDYR